MEAARARAGLPVGQRIRRERGLERAARLPHAAAVRGHERHGEPSFYPQNHVGRGRGIRNRAVGAVRLPKILVLTIDDLMSRLYTHKTMWDAGGG